MLHPAQAIPRTTPHENEDVTTTLRLLHEQLSGSFANNKQRTTRNTNNKEGGRRPTQLESSNPTRVLQQPPTLFIPQTANPPTRTRLRPNDHSTGRHHDHPWITLLRSYPIPTTATFHPIPSHPIPKPETHPNPRSKHTSYHTDSTPPQTHPK